MRKITLALVSVVMLMACSNCGKHRSVEYEEERPVFSIDSIAGVDTIVAKEQTDKSDAVSPASSFSSSRHKSVTHDNMRGFDPASEDDLDDNGMSRYMENNDDEGWD